MIERKITMADGRPVRSNGRWMFDLQVAHTLQFRITSEQGAGGDIFMEGHDISTLLDYLYDDRELIYEPTHDPRTSHSARRGAGLNRCSSRPTMRREYGP